jgi:predicted peptidase
MPQQPETLDKTITLPVRCRYLVYLPAAYGQDPARPWPMILFLHGAGERGDDLALLKSTGLPKLLDKRSDFPFVVISPQVPLDGMHSTVVLSALLDEVLAQYAIDADRIYLTGLSMGGGGAWDLAMEAPHRFAALVPICGNRVNPLLAGRLRNLPIWVFHGARDSVVPLETSERMVRALRAAGNNVKFTVYPHAEHDSWTPTYDDPALYEWLLSHRRPQQA